MPKKHSEIRSPERFPLVWHNQVRSAIGKTYQNRDIVRFRSLEQARMWQREFSWFRRCLAAKPEHPLTQQLDGCIIRTKSKTNGETVWVEVWNDGKPVSIEQVVSALDAFKARDPGERKS